MDKAYDFIRSRILSGEYSPGHPLMVDFLASEIGVSRTPIRDALRMLNGDGLVSILPRQVASVRKMKIEEFREMCELRLGLETCAAGLAARKRNDTDLEEIRQALEAMRRLTDQLHKEPEDKALVLQLVREDVRFHLAIIAAAKNALVTNEILRLHLINRVVSAPLTPEQVPLDAKQMAVRRSEVMRSHDAIYAAIYNGDLAASKLAMEQHIQDIIDLNLSRMRIMSGSPAREPTPEQTAAYGS